jgi:hypothetical protein
MHTHTTNGLAVACTEGGLAQNNFYSAQLHDMVAYHDFEGITIHADEAPRLLASMASKPLMILRNHGLLTHGRDAAAGLREPVDLQRACDVQVTQARLGRAIAIPEAVAIKTTHDSFQFDAALRRRPGRVRCDDAPDGKAHTAPATSHDPMKVCIYGAGAIGGWIGVKLAQRGLRGERGRARRDPRGIEGARSAAAARARRSAPR